MFASPERSKQQASHNCNNPESFSWQRSVKRKYDNLAQNEINGSGRQSLASSDPERDRNIEGVSESGSLFVEKVADYGSTVVWERPKENNGIPYTDECNSCMPIFLKSGRRSLLCSDLESQYKSFSKHVSRGQEDTSQSIAWQWPRKKNVFDIYNGASCIDQNEPSRHCTQFSLTRQQSHLATANDEITALKVEIQRERAAFNALYAELEEERNASAEAAKEAMTMIARLQEEKAAIQMEARQYKRMAEEREAHDQEAVTLLKELLVTRDNDMFTLENELQAYRRILQSIEPERWKGLTFKQDYLVKGTKEAGSPPHEFKTDFTCFPDCLNSGNEAVMEAHKKLSQGVREDSSCLSCDSMTCNLVTNFDNVGWDWQEARSHYHNVSSRSAVCKQEIGQDMHCPFENENRFSGDVSKPTSRQWLKEPRKRMSATKKRELFEDEHGSSYIWQNSELDIGTMKDPADVNLPQPIQVDAKTVEPMLAKEGSVSPVWDHIKRLEERLDLLGEQQECQKKWFPEWPISSVVQPVGSDGAPSVCQKCIWQNNSKHMYPFIDVVAHSGCVSGNEKDHIFAKQITTERFAYETGAEIAENKFQRDTIRQDASLCCKLEESYHRSDSSEGILDIYEVQSGVHESGQHFSLEQNPEKEDNTGDRLGKPDSCTAPLIESEAGYCHEETVQEATGSGNTNSYLPSTRGSSGDPLLPPVIDCCSSGSKSHQVHAPFAEGDICICMVGEEVQQMTCRMQDLAAERAYIKQAVESLRQENIELKLLQEIAYQVRELQGTIKKSQQVKELSKTEQRPFHSFLKGIFPFSRFLCILHPWYSKFAFLFQRKTGSGLQHGECVGLSVLLHESCYLRTVACLRRRLKVKFRCEKSLCSRMDSTKSKSLVL